MVCLCQGGCQVGSDQEDTSRKRWRGTKRALDSSKITGTSTCTLPLDDTTTAGPTPQCHDLAGTSSQAAPRLAAAWDAPRPRGPSAIDALVDVAGCQQADEQHKTCRSKAKSPAKTNTSAGQACSLHCVCGSPCRDQAKSLVSALVGSCARWAVPVDRLIRGTPMPMPSAYFTMVRTCVGWLVVYAYMPEP